MSQINSKFFSLTKEKSTNTIQKINETLSEIKINKPIHELKIYNKSLLFWAGTFENEILLDDLLKINEFNKKEEIIPILNILIPNKNPTLLAKIINTVQLDLPLAESIASEIYPKIALNCYRAENIHTNQHFLQKNLNDTDKYKFIEKCFENINLPILNQINNITEWHQLIVKYIQNNQETIDKSTHSYFYNKLQKTPNSQTIQSTIIIDDSSPEKNELPTIEPINNIVIPTIIKKKRRLIG